MPTPAVRARLEPLLVDGLVATCGIIDLETGFSAHAAAAASAGLSLLHYDADVERIAEITGQAHGCVVPRGSV